MRKFAVALFLLAPCFGQQYEIGVAGGGAFAAGGTVTGSAGSATAGLKPGFAVGAVVGHHMYKHVSGEVRYTFRQGDLKLSSGGTQATFAAQTHAFHYDVLFHPNKSEAKVLPFVAAGGGFKVYQGTGTEAAYQPLSQYAYLTKTTEWKPLISGGAGIRFMAGAHTAIRIEFRDYITPFPKKVITPAPGSKISGWLNDFVPMVGISYTF